MSVVIHPASAAARRTSRDEYRAENRASFAQVNEAMDPVETGRVNMARAAGARL